MTATPHIQDLQPVRADAAAPAVAWVVPLAAALAVVGALTPWFRPRGTMAGHARTFDALYSVKDKVGLAVPVLLVLAAISVVGLLRGNARGRLATTPTPARLAALYTLAAGVGSVVALVVAWVMVPSLYRFVVSAHTLSWDQYQRAGVRLARGPEAGFWLSTAAAVLTVAAGVVMLLVSRRDRPPSGA